MSDCCASYSDIRIVSRLGFIALCFLIWGKTEKRK